MPNESVKLNDKITRLEELLCAANSGQVNILKTYQDVFGGRKAPDFLQEKIDIESDKEPEVMVVTVIYERSD